ncbi:MAG: filamentous hemagglutinin N-terminal domain-containing protein [Rubrivivax sp.]|nr:filamentous hemagglutinin N-terminal domain-containing protein [Rubrivivax sp.]
MKSKTMLAALPSASRPNLPRPRPTLLTAALLAAGLCTQAPVFAAPEGGTVRAGSASITAGGAQTRIDQASARAIIDWRSFSVGAAENVLFVQPTAQSATLNRVTGSQLSQILGRIDANGQVFLVNPNGIVFGRGAQVNVGALVASTANIGNADFMAARLAFGQAGQAGAAVVNEGRITAAEGGLVALVAPSVRNDGLIQARLGRVALGAGDTFALDLYGDGLVSLAMDRSQLARIEHSGRIEADGGRVVLVSAATAKAALDSVVNLSGTVRADAVQQQGGRIVLLAHGGTAEVTGTLSAQGGADAAGGRVEVLGTNVHLGSAAAIDVSGGTGGGTVLIGGAWQGSGSTPRASSTTVDAGARIAADATRQGRGGEVVVWSDGTTRYAGSISARGAGAGGDGGRVEVSGKGTLDFAGVVDASALAGNAGSLLLDPATMTIGAAEAALISRVLRTGTSTTVTADVDINVGAAIDGRGRIAGGGLTLTAGRDINIDQFIVTANGAVRLNAGTGTVRVAANRGVFSGNAPITVAAGADLVTGAFVTSGALALASSAGSVVIATPLDAALGAVTVNAAQDVRIEQPVVNLRNGSAFTATAGRDVIVNAQIDGRGGAGGGALSLTAAGSVQFNESAITDLGELRVRAIAGTIATAANRGLFTLGGSTLDLSAGADFTTGVLGTTGALNLTSTGGAVTIGQGIDATVGATTIRAATDANLDTPVLNLRSGAPLAVTAGRDITVRAPIDGRNGAASGGTATLTAGRNVTLADSIVTNEGAIAVTATAGTVAQPAGVQLRSGAAPIAVTAGADLTTASYVTTGSLALRSTGGALTVAESIYDSVGNTTLGAATDITVAAAARVENVRTGAALTMSAGRDIVVDGQVGQDRDALTLTGPITLAAGRNVTVNNDVVTRDAPLTITASTGTVTVASQIAGQPAGVRPQVRSGSGALTVSAGADLAIGNPAAPRPSPETPYLTTGALSLASTGGTLFIESPIPATTGTVSLLGGNAVVVNERIYSNNGDITITAGLGGIVMNTASIDVVDPATNTPYATTLSDIDARLGNLTLIARGDINAPSVRTAGTLSITSTEGHITSGRVVGSRNSPLSSLGMPQRVVLAGALGIDSFFTDTSPDVEARSSQGSVNLSVFAPQRLYIQAAQDVVTGGWIGQQVELVAGRDVLLTSLAAAGLVRANAGRDFSLQGMSLINALNVNAGQDVRLPTGAGDITWIEGAGGNLTLRDPASAGTVLAMRGLTLAAGRDVTVPQPVHVSDSLAITNIEATLMPTTLAAGRNVTLGQLETIGDVTLTAATGNVTVGFPLGAPVGVAPGLWNPTDLGVRTLTISAPGTGAVVNLQGSRSFGNTVIVAPNGGTVTSAYHIGSTNGTVTIVAPTVVNPVTAIPLQVRLTRPAIVSPAIAPGPLRAGPDGPLIPAAPAPGGPALAEVLVSAPGAIDAGALAAPGQGASGGDGSAEAAASAARGTGASRSGDEGGASSESEQAVSGGRGIVLYSGGRGIALAADLGRSGTFGSVRTPPREADEEEQRRRRSGGGGGNGGSSGSEGKR